MTKEENISGRSCKSSSDWQKSVWLKHGTGFLCEVLAGVTAELAAAHPDRGRVRHLGDHAAHRNVEGVGPGESRNLFQSTVSDEQEWPADEDTSDDAWSSTLDELRRNHETLRGDTSAG